MGETLTADALTRLAASDDDGPASLPWGESAASFDRRFRDEVAELVHEMLRWSQAEGRSKLRQDARMREQTVERVLAGAIARRIMKKVDAEYL